jgi:transposase
LAAVDSVAAVALAAYEANAVTNYHVLKQGVPYHELGGDYFDRRDDPDHLVQRLVGQLECLGQPVTLESAAAT